MTQLFQVLHSRFDQTYCWSRKKKHNSRAPWLREILGRQRIIKKKKRADSRCPGRRLHEERIRRYTVSCVLCIREKKKARAIVFPPWVWILASLNQKRLRVCIQLLLLLDWQQLCCMFPSEDNRRLANDIYCIYMQSYFPLWCRYV